MYHVCIVGEILFLGKETIIFFVRMSYKKLKKDMAA
jgi:hypothetical protein